MKIEVSYDEDSDKLFFTEIRRKTVNLDNFFTPKLYAPKFEDKEHKALVSKTFAIIEFPNIKTFEDFKTWGLKRVKERKKLVKLLREVYKILNQGDMKNES